MLNHLSHTGQGNMDLFKNPPDDSHLHTGNVETNWHSLDPPECTCSKSSVTLTLHSKFCSLISNPQFHFREREGDWDKSFMATVMYKDFTVCKNQGCGPTPAHLSHLAEWE